MFVPPHTWIISCPENVNSSHSALWSPNDSPAQHTKMTPFRPTPTATRALTTTTLLKTTTSPPVTTTPIRTHATSSVSADELSHFSSLASSWWDPMGPSRALHLMNPLRHDFVASCLADGPPLQDEEYTSPEQKQAPANLHYLDVGCGGGIFAESLARTIGGGGGSASRAASITAIDPSTTLIRIAREHARTDPRVEAHLRSRRFQYQNRTLEDLVENTPTTATQSGNQTQSQAGRFDVVTLFEVLEHIDPQASSPISFLTNCLRLVKPGGWLIGSTIARSLSSFLVNKAIAEAPWPIGVVPRGTHEWGKFVNPDEVKAWAQEGLMRADDAGRVERAGVGALNGSMWVVNGVVYFPGIGWRMVSGSEDWGNYFWGVRRGF